MTRQPDDIEFIVRRAGDDPFGDKELRATKGFTSQDIVNAVNDVRNGAYAPRVADWASGVDYAVGELVANAGTLYRTTTAHTAGISFDGTKFTAIGGGGGGAPTGPAGGDLGGSYPNPTVPGLASKAPIAGPFAPSLTGAVAATRYVGGTAAGAPGTGTFLLGDFVIDQQGLIWVCTTAGSPGTWTQVGNGAAAVFASAFGVTNGAVTSPWKPPNPIGPELWATANFLGGVGDRNTSTLTPSITCNGTAQDVRTIVSMLDRGNGNLVGNDTAWRLSGTITQTLAVSGWFSITVQPVDAGGTAVVGTNPQFLFTNGQPWNGDFVFEFKVAWATGGTYLDVKLQAYNNLASGTLTLSNMSLRLLPHETRPILYANGTGVGVNAPILHTRVFNPVTDLWHDFRTDLNADGALTNSLGPITQYNGASPWRWPGAGAMDSTFAYSAGNVTQTQGAVDEVLPTGMLSRSGRINNNDQILEVLKQDGTTWELRGNTHNGETNVSTTWEVDPGTGVWASWAGTDRLLKTCRRFRATLNTKITRSAPDSDDIATVAHVMTFFPDGMMRMDRTTTFLKAVTLRSTFEWMSSHDTTVPKIGRIGRGVTTLDEVDTYVKVDVPVAPTAAANNAAGSLAAATYRYVITSLTEIGESLPSPAVTQAVTGGTSTVTLTLPAAATGQTGWRVYGRANAIERAVLLATLAPTAATWADDGTIPAFGPQPPKVTTARRLDTATTAQDAGISGSATWTVWRDLLTGFCFGHIYDRDSVLGRAGVGGSRQIIERGSGIMKQYLLPTWTGGADSASIANGTVWTVTHWAYTYIPQDPNGRWETEIGVRSADITTLKALYPAT